VKCIRCGEESHVYNGDYENLYSHYNGNCRISWSERDIEIFERYIIQREPASSVCLDYGVSKSMIIKICQRHFLKIINVDISPNAMRKHMAETAGATA